MRYLFVDIECIAGKEWINVAAVMVDMNNWTVEDYLDVHHYDAREQKMDRSTVKFWAANKDALDHIELQTDGTREAAEKNICEFFNSLEGAYWIVSDNPSFDVAIVDDIMLKHGHRRTCFRQTGEYHQPLCSWSYTLGLRQLIKVPSYKTKTKIPTISVGCALIPHTALYDCTVNAQKMINVKAMVHSRRNQQYRRTY